MISELHSKSALQHSPKQLKEKSNGSKQLVWFNPTLQKLWNPTLIWRDIYTLDAQLNLHPIQTGATLLACRFWLKKRVNNISGLQDPKLTYYLHYNLSQNLQNRSPYLKLNHTKIWIKPNVLYQAIFMLLGFFICCSHLFSQQVPNYSTCFGECCFAVKLQKCFVSIGVIRQWLHFWEGKPIL